MKKNLQFPGCWEHSRTKDMGGAVKESISAGQGPHLDPAVYRLFLELSLDHTSVCIQIHLCPCREASHISKSKASPLLTKGNERWEVKFKKSNKISTFYKLINSLKSQSPAEGKEGRRHLFSWTLHEAAVFPSEMSCASAAPGWTSHVVHPQCHCVNDPFIAISRPKEGKFLKISWL